MVIKPKKMLMGQKPKHAWSVTKTGETGGETWNYPKPSCLFSFMFKLADGRVIHSVRFG
jgi:hypothetical protein